MKIIDTSSNTKKDVCCIAQQGIEIIFRYYDTTTSWKVITAAEAQAISDAGMQIGIVFEHGNCPTSFTEPNGFDHACCAFTYATETIKQPFNSAIYFAVDFDASEAVITKNIIPFFKGVQKAFNKLGNGGATFKIGAYGCGATINKLKKLGLCEYRWLSQSTSFNGTSEAKNKCEYELIQLPKFNLEVCSIGVDEDAMNPTVSDVGAFSL